MGRVRFGLRSGFFFLVLAGVAAPLAMTTNAAEGRHHLDVPAQRVHDSGLVDRVYATFFSQAAAQRRLRPNPLTLNVKCSNQSRPMPLEDG